MSDIENTSTVRASLSSSSTDGLTTANNNTTPQSSKPIIKTSSVSRDHQQADNMSQDNSNQQMADIKDLTLTVDRLSKKLEDFIESTSEVLSLGSRYPASRQVCVLSWVRKEPYLSV